MKHTFGTCTRCGKNRCKTTIVDDIDQVCEDCLETFFSQCDDCGEYWDDSYVEFFVTTDDRYICEHCREDYDDEDIVEDDK